MLFKKGVLKNLAKFTGNHLCQGLFFNKVGGLGLISWNFLRHFFFTGHPRATSSGLSIVITFLSPIIIHYDILCFLKKEVIWAI